MELRDYQTKVVDETMAALAEGLRVLLVAPTGSGKTIIFCEIIKRFIAEDKSVIVLAHRRELIDQCADKLNRFDVPHSILMAGREFSLFPDVVVATIQTLASRMRRKDYRAPSADLIVIDEAHRSRAESYVRVVELCPDAMVLGVTATPVRGDGRGLGRLPEIPEEEEGVTIDLR